VGDLVPQLLRPVEVRRREVVDALCRVAVLAVGEVSLDDPREAIVRKEIARKAVERGRVPRDSRGDEDSAGAENASRFAQRSRPIRGVDEVIQGAEEKHQRHGLAGGGKRSGVADTARCQSARRGL
jgi:hypothetical protein